MPTAWREARSAGAPLDSQPANVRTDATSTQGTNTPPGCRTTVTATVGDAHVFSGTRVTRAGWITLSAPGVPTTRQDQGVGDWSAMNLKTGQLVGAAPWRQQVAQM